MELRYCLAVVSPAGDGTGREVAVHLARAGAAVLVVDADDGAAERTADLLRPARTRAWWLQADPALEVDARLVTHRARDLGGADVVVDLADAPTYLAGLLVDDGGVRRGPRAAQPVVTVVRATDDARTHTCRRVTELELGPGGTASDVLALLRRA